MSKRQVIILWIIAAALAAGVALLKITQDDATQSSTERSAGETLFASFPITEISGIHIKGVAGEVILKKTNNTWIVSNRDDYPAKASTVNEFLRTVESAKITRAIEAGPSFAPSFGMDENSTRGEERGITATFQDLAGNDLAKVSFGKSIINESDGGLVGGMMVGRYIRNHADTSGFYGTKDMFPSVSVEAGVWLDTTFVNLEKIQSIRLTKEDSQDIDWAITRETEDAAYQLVDAAEDEVANSKNTDPLKSLFSYVRFEDVVPANEVERRSAEKGTRTATVQTFEGFTYTFQITPARNSLKCLMTAKVTADLPKERKKEDGESEEDAKTKDAAFAKRLKTLQEKLDNSTRYEGRTYLLAKSSVSSLLKARGEIATKATPAKEESDKESSEEAPPEEE